MKKDLATDEVFVLQHAYERADGEDEVKFIGVYSTLVKAEEAVARLKQQPGFKDHPNDFCIDRYEIDKDHWLDGFISSDEA